MSPTIIVDNQDNIRLIVGASGGSKIISSVAQVIQISILFYDHIYYKSTLLTRWQSKVFGWV